ncbi:araC-like ligand binding domain protein, partial [Vibrio parahaemolyticus IDH02640]
SIT